MTQKSMMYDSPVYQTVLPIQVFGTGTLAGGIGIPTMTGANAISNKYVAFTNMLIKSLTLQATTIGTAGTNTGVLVNPSILRFTNNGTNAVTTLTATYSLAAYALIAGNTAAMTTSAYVVNAIPTAVSGTTAASGNSYALVNGAIPLIQGDSFAVVKSSDATEVVAVTAEVCIAPNAPVTALG